MWITQSRSCDILFGTASTWASLGRYSTTTTTTRVVRREIKPRSHIVPVIADLRDRGDSSRGGLLHPARCGASHEPLGRGDIMGGSEICTTSALSPFDAITGSLCCSKNGTVEFPRLIRIASIASHRVCFLFCMWFSVTSSALPMTTTHNSLCAANPRASTYSNYRTKAQGRVNTDSHHPTGTDTRYTMTAR